MTMQLWGRLSSINVRKVVLCAQWLGIELPRTDAGMAFGVVDTPAYRAMNPNGLVPVLQDGDFTLWESNAIVRYLCAKAGRGYPARKSAVKYSARTIATCVPAEKSADAATVSSASSTNVPAMAAPFPSR